MDFVRDIGIPKDYPSGGQEGQFLVLECIDKGSTNRMKVSSSQQKEVRIGNEESQIPIEDFKAIIQFVDGSWILQEIEGRCWVMLQNLFEKTQNLCSKPFPLTPGLDIRLGKGVIFRVSYAPTKKQNYKNEEEISEEVIKSLNRLQTNIIT